MKKKKEEEVRATAEARNRTSSLAKFKQTRAKEMTAKREADKKALEESEKHAAEKAKREAFRSRHAMFEKKEGPTEEERIKDEITKASQTRRFDKQMKNMMASAPGKNPLMMEMNLRAKIGNTTVRTQSDGSVYEGTGTQEGGCGEVSRQRVAKRRNEKGCLGFNDEQS